MSAKNKYMYLHSLTSHEGVICKTSTSEEDWRKLKDYFTDAATRLDVKKVNYYIWFHVTLHFMEIKHRAKAFNTKSAFVRNTKRSQLMLA